MNKFKVGDRVYYQPTKKKLTITGLRRSRFGCTVYVDLVSGATDIYFEYELKPIIRC